MTEARVIPFGEDAFLVVLGETIDPVLNARAHALAHAWDSAADAARHPLPAVIGYASVLVRIDPVTTAADTVERRLGALLEAVAGDDRAPGEGTLHRVPVRYGGEDGPDLADVCRLTGLSRDGVVALHAGTEYRVYLLGFSPGFAYLGPLPEPLRVSRLATPRIRVPPGSVAIAESQTAIYPSATPGGWRLIGRTPLEPWRVDREPPALFAPGDRIRFEPLG